MRLTPSIGSHWNAGAAFSPNRRFFFFSPSAGAGASSTAAGTATFALSLAFLTGTATSSSSSSSGCLRFSAFSFALTGTAAGLAFDSALFASLDSASGCFALTFLTFAFGGEGADSASDWGSSTGAAFLAGFPPQLELTSMMVVAENSPTPPSLPS